MLLAAQAQAQTYPISLQGLLLGADGNPLSGNTVSIFRQQDAALEIASSEVGVLILNATDKGVQVDQVANDGVAINQAGRFGLNVANSLRGVNINTTTSDGLLVGNAGRHGLYVFKAAQDGVVVQEAGSPGTTLAADNRNNGVEVQGAQMDGLFVGRADQIGVNIQSTGSNGIQVGAAGIDGLQIQSAGRDGIRVSSATDPIADAWTVYSSRRWKKNIQPLGDALEKVKRLRGVTYDWKANDRHDIGLIAEEVGEVFPEVVAFEQNGVDAQSVDYARLVAVLIEAIKEQQALIDQLNDRLNALAGVPH
jgi:hypothetical protein